MNKKQFLSALEKKLKGLPKEDRDKSLDYYGEMIDDRIDDGMAEEDAVKEMGSVDEIADGIIKNVPLGRLIKSSFSSFCEKKGTNWLLIILSSIIWLPVLASVLAVAVTLYAVVWSVAVCIYAVSLTLALAGLGMAVCSFSFIFAGRFSSFALFLGGGILCVGLAILAVPLANIFAKKIVKLTVFIFVWIKKLFVKKEDDNEKDN